MTARRALLAASVGMLAAVLPVLAHHSFAAEFDQNKPLKISGTCTKVEWMNPHAHFYVDVKDDAGAVTNWDFELASPNVLLMQGWTRNSLKAGDQITVEGFTAKDGAKMANARKVTLPDGRKVFAGSTADGEPTK
jgi:Family of unknown function (DUF6152)